MSVGALETAPSFESRRRVVGAKLGRYQVGPRIGVGGSAAVYLARTTGPMSSEEFVAIKVVHEHLSEEEEFISQFRDEANLLVRVAHPNIVRVKELGRENDTLFLAMEYLHGQPLSKLASTLARRGAHLDSVLVAWLGARVAEGLAYAHELTDDQSEPLALVHRDVSPQNVFVTYQGEVKLIDFGIARAAGRIVQTTLGRVKGKFSYMAPEQVLGREFDHRADLFALGATLYEVAVGARLFAGGDETETLHKLLFEEVPDPAARVPGFPPELSKILSHALEGEPSKRYSTAQELAQDLDDFVRASGVEDPRAGLVELMATLFEADRQAQERSIDSLRAESFEALTESVHVDRTSGVVSMRRASTKAQRRWPYAAGGTAVVLTLGVMAMALNRDRVPVVVPAPSAAPVALEVNIEVTTHPDVEATVLIDGVAARGKPRRVSVARSEAAVSVEVSAPGFEPSKISVVPDRDRTVVIPLTKIPEPNAAPPPSATARPRGRPPPVKAGDPLVTEYPFGKK